MLLRELDEVIDPEPPPLRRRREPARRRAGSRSTAPGKFSYRESLDGDGRVPHELGLLEGVTTYWVDRGVHGDLVKHTQRPRRDHGAAADRRDLGAADGEAGEAARQRGARDGWVTAERRRAARPARSTRSSRGRSSSGGAGAPPELTPEEQIRLENLAFAEYLGTGDERRGRCAGEPAEARASSRGRARRAEALAGDPADADRRGRLGRRDEDRGRRLHGRALRQGVLPQRAELALDRAVSRASPGRRTTTHGASSSPSTRGGGTFAPRSATSPSSRGADERCRAGRRRRRHGTAGHVRRRGPAPPRPQHRDRRQRAPGCRARRAASSSAPARGRSRSPTPCAGTSRGSRTRRTRSRRAGTTYSRQPVEKLIVAERDRGRAEEILEAFKEELRSGAGVAEGGVGRARPVRRAQARLGRHGLGRGRPRSPGRVARERRRRRRASRPEAERSPRSWRCAARTRRCAGSRARVPGGRGDDARDSARPRFRSSGRTCLEPRRTREDPRSDLLLARRHKRSGPPPSTSRRPSRSAWCA